MFPLKRRRKFARIHKKGLIAKVSYNNSTFEAKIKDISASGCCLSLDNETIVIPDNSIVLIEFTLNEYNFKFKASKVRENSFNFIFDDRELQTKLNNEILVEYFSDTPELIPVDKK